MKKFSLCAFICLFTSNLIADQLLPTSRELFKYKISGKEEKMSQSFIFPRPAYRLIEAREFLAHEFFASKNCGGTGFQAVGIFQKAGASERVGRYFAINDQNILSVRGDTIATRNGNVRDVRAEWLGLGADFNEELSLTPQQTQWAAYPEFQQDFARFTDNWLISSFYVSLAFPVQHVKNNMNFVAPLELQQAFNRRELTQAKIPTQSASKTSIAEIIGRLGSYFLKDDGFELGVYSLLHIPTAKEAKPEFLFDPFLGHNNHWGYGTGVNIQLPLNCCTDERVFAFYADLEHLFLFRSTQERTLDVRLKPWSRYMLVNSKNGLCNIPAANILTRKVRVEPYSQFDMSTGLRLYNDSLAFEFGYGLWVHGSEWLRLKEPWLEDYGFAGRVIPGEPPLVVNCVTVCPTASESTISCQAPNDVDAQGNLVFVPIKWQDLNFYSGAARAALVSRAHVAIGYKCDGQSFAFFMGAGAFGEFPSLNTAFSQWGVWGKLGCTF